MKIEIGTPTERLFQTVHHCVASKQNENLVVDVIKKFNLSWEMHPKFPAGNWKPSTGPSEKRREGG